MHPCRRSHETGRRRRPALQSAAESLGDLHESIGHRDGRRDRQPDDARCADITHTFDQRQRLTERESVAGQTRHAQQQERGAMAAREGLQHEPEQRQSQITRPPFREIAVERRQRERHPLDGGQMRLREAGEPRRREREDDPAQNRRGHAEAEAARQHEASERAQHARQQQHRVQRQHVVAGEPDDRRGDDAAADETFGIGQRVGARIVDVRVEDAGWIVRERVRVPRQRPDVEVHVRPVGQHRVTGASRQRIGEHAGEDRVQQHHQGQRARAGARRRVT